MKNDANQAAQALYWSIQAEKAPLGDLLFGVPAMRRANRLLVVDRPAIDIDGRTHFDPAVEEAMASLFRSLLVERVDASSWPGTAVFGHRARVWIVAYDEALGRRMVDVDNNLWHWVCTGDRPLPEDLCLFTAGESRPILFSVTHERSAWLLSEAPPEKLEGFTFSPMQRALMVPDDPMFCDRSVQHE